MTTRQTITRVSALRYQATGHRRLAKALGGIPAVELVKLARQCEAEAATLESKLPVVVGQKESVKP